MRVTLSLAVLLLSFAGAHAQDAAAERAVVEEQRAQEARGVESIGEEAAEVGADDAADVAGDDEDRSAGGMSTVEDELNAAEDDDGCTGAMGATCPGGDN
jgi:hypothetical protein